ncbi:hypothetical protein ASE92_15780 [Pedobacter sp. Leaf41]|uniref:glycosyltransferase family 2 protein n=1 Tax=Pedobacter sp. Leaf41 TaxID=1736218 RepID=UPI0007023D1B|nr:glycosyltransferase family 2 protein [Pedobacter sp. Leaf41]KQN34083.1 hypothetical protein ASE92_15780 [Pedobacter sp. Leaf41]
MKISVITVVYNNQQTIRDAINSVLSQTYNDIEYIVIDGGSTDNTIEIVKSYKDKINVFISEKDNGLYHAMNKGINLASGDVIGILNSDDFYSDHKVLSDVMENFNSDKKLDFLYGNLVYVKQDDTNRIVRNWKSKNYYDNFFEHANVPPHPSLFVRKSIYDEVGLFNLKYKIAADYELMIRFMKMNKFNFKYYDRLIVHMRLGGESNKSLKNVYLANKEVANAWTDNNFKMPIYFFPLKIIKRMIQFIK